MNSPLWLLLMVGVLLSVVGMVKGDKALQSGNFGVKFEGKSAHIVFFRVDESNNNSNSNVFYKLMFKSIEEHDANGKVPQGHKVPNLNGPDSSWSAVQTTGNYTNVNFTNQFTVGNEDGTLFIETYLYDKETQVQNGQETVTVKSNSLKFTINIAHWNFQDSENTLHFYMSMVLNGGSKADTTEKDGSVSQLEVTNDDDSAYPLYIDFPGTAVYDGTNKDVVVSADLKGKIDLEFAFHSFTDTLAYDPDVGLVAVVSGLSAVEITMIVLGVITGTIILGVLVAGFIYYRKKHQPERKSLMT
jgi:uncharacterized cupredoxin-like copper-binding protein